MQSSRTGPHYRLFSRCPGWNVLDPPSELRHYWSPAVEVPAHLQQAWRGWTGEQVASAIRPELAKENPSLQRLQQIARQYPEWFLYPEDTAMGCGPEHYV